jgi:hypothetical protein
MKFPWRLEFETHHQGGAFSQDGRIIASASDNHLLFFESSSGKRVATYSGHNENITSISFSTDGKFIITTSEDKTVRIWKSPERTTEPQKNKHNHPLIDNLEKCNPTLRLSPRLDEEGPSSGNESPARRSTPNSRRRSLSPNRSPSSSIGSPSQSGKQSRSPSICSLPGSRAGSRVGSMQDLHDHDTDDTNVTKVLCNGKSEHNSKLMEHMTNHASFGYGKSEHNGNIGNHVTALV